jgi:hypothetical protein
MDRIMVLGRQRWRTAAWCSGSPGEHAVTGHKNRQRSEVAVSAARVDHRRLDAVRHESPDRTPRPFPTMQPDGIADASTAGRKRQGAHFSSDAARETQIRPPTASPVALYRPYRSPDPDNRRCLRPCPLIGADRTPWHAACTLPYMRQGEEPDNR